METNRNHRIRQSEKTSVISVALFPGYLLKSRERVASFPGSHAPERKHLINYKKKKHKKINKTQKTKKHVMEM